MYVCATRIERVVNKPGAEINDLMRDHPHLGYVIKDLYHSLGNH